MQNLIQWWPGVTRQINAVKDRANQQIGDYVCKYGETTDYTCGTIASKSFWPSYIPYPISFTYILVDPTEGYNPVCEPEDSGGPFFNGDTAFGTTSGSFLGSSCIYMAADYIPAGLGVDVWFGSCLRQDVTGDGYVNILDISTVAGQWGRTGTPGWIPSDVVPDGVINIFDLSTVGTCM